MFSKTISSLAILLLILCSAGTVALLAAGGDNAPSVMSGVAGERRLG